MDGFGVCRLATPVVCKTNQLYEWSYTTYAMHPFNAFPFGNIRWFLVKVNVCGKVGNLTL